ncbi:MAG TPA: response regulator [Rhodospirillales bacterium]|nr:response regulator [Rhodospirillales bacterium]
MTEKVLIIDDDVNLLAGLKRQFRKRFDLCTAESGEQALALVKSHGPFAVAVCDMRMPGMDGIEVLGALKKLAPNTVRMMLTGNADQQTAINAINEGNIFRFFTKPCPPETLANGIKDGQEQYQLVTAERELLEKTLAGSVRILTDVLSMVDPEAFGKATKLRDWARKLAGYMNLPQPWKLDMAVMLSRIGWVAVPAEIQMKVRAREKLTHIEEEMIHEIPETGRKWIANIPRLKPVAEIVYYQDKCFDGGGFPDVKAGGEDIPLESRILKILNDLAEVSPDMVPGKDVFKLLEGQAKIYDPVILRAARECLSHTDGDAEGEERHEVAELPVSLIMAGHKLLSDIETENGQLILSRGLVITDAQMAKLRNIGRIHGIKEPIRVLKSLPTKA